MTTDTHVLGRHFDQQFARDLLVTPDGQAQQRLGTALAAAGSGGAVAMPATTHFYADQGALVGRIGDRLLIGAASDNPAQANRDATPRDWLSTVMAGTSIGAYATWGAQTASLARFGTISILGGSRSSDAHASNALLGYTPASIGVASWGVNDDTTNPTSTNAWAFYGEAWRMAGVNYQPTFGMELECVNFGGLPTGVSNPYQVNVGGGTYALQLGAGGGQTSGTYDASAVMTVVRNPNAYQMGIVFGANSLTGTTGSASDTGYASAVVLGRNQGIEWHTPETSGGVVGLNAGAIFRSTIALAANAMHLEFQDSGLVLSTPSGAGLWAAAVVPSPTSYIQQQAGTGTAGPQINVFGAAANVDLNLNPRGTGSLKVNGNIAWHGGNLSFGSGLTLSAGVLTAPGGGYTLPTASTTTLGGIKIDGSTITIASGVVSASTDATRYAASNPSNYQTATQVATSLTPYAPLATPGFGTQVRIVDGSQTQLLANVTGAGTDGKLSDVITQGTGIYYRLLKDDQSASVNWLAVNRAGLVASAITLTGTTITLAGTVGLSTPLPITSGGVGATTASIGRANLNRGTVALTSGATVATDASLGNAFSLTLATNATLSTPTNLAAGASYAWTITQDGTGTRTLAFGSAFKWPGGAAGVLSTAAGAVDVLTAVSNGTALYAVLSKGFA